MRPWVKAPSDFDDLLWVDEQIWGHRLHDEQGPWLTMLEFLTVLHHHSEAPLEGHREVEGPLRYRPQRQLRLRNILFNNPHFLEVLVDPNLPSEEAWRLWTTRMAHKPLGVAEGEAHYEDLQQAFPDFADFVKVVEYLRRTAVEGLGGKRWTTRFVYPFGPASLYEDLREKGGSFQTDRLFFARNGELLYLMLCRSRRAAELGPQLVKLFFDRPNPSERLVEVLQGKAQLAPGDDLRKGGVLPYIRSEDFDALADDWARLLARELPAFDVLPHLVTITTLHLLLYFLRRAAEILELPRPTLALEMVISQRTAIRDIAAQSFEQNNTLPARAVEAFVRTVEGHEAWRQAMRSDSPQDGVCELLDQIFHWPSSEQRAEFPSGISPGGILDHLVEEVRGRHSGHVGKIHATWTKAIGLASKRSSRRLRYAPTDQFLKTLVLCCVERRMEFKAFLATLYERYGIVIGEIEGGSWVTDGLADRQAFERNARRLEERLTSLGLGERLSDACAYVHSVVERGR